MLLALPFYDVRQVWLRPASCGDGGLAVSGRTVVPGGTSRQCRDPLPAPSCRRRDDSVFIPESHIQIMVAPVDNTPMTVASSRTIFEIDANGGPRTSSQVIPSLTRFLEQAGTAAQPAAAARAAFRSKAKCLADQVARGLIPFERKPLTEMAEWYTDVKEGLLVLVVGAHEAPDVTDDVLAYALAWQCDRDLVLIVPETHVGLTLQRLPWIATPVRVFTYGAGLTVTPAIVPARAEVLAAAAGPACPLRSTSIHDLNARAAWVAGLMRGADDSWALVAAHRHSYLAWHCAGRQVLRIRRAGKGVRIEAGVNYGVAPSGDEMPLVLDVKGPVTPPQRAEIEARVARAVWKRLAGDDAGHVEHRLQAALAATELQDLGLTRFAREYPAWRGAGRPGFVDFLGLDRRNRLHVIETKVGTADVKGVLQALDYATWVSAHGAEIRAERGWAQGSTDERVVLDFVLAPRRGGKAIGPYLAGQLEALAGDLAWRVAVIVDPLADIPEVSKPLWRALPASGSLVAAPVQHPRWAARTAAALRGGQE
jgi:hypothetical protein